MKRMGHGLWRSRSRFSLYSIYVSYASTTTRPLPNLADFYRTSNRILVPRTGFSSLPINKTSIAVIARLRILGSRNVVHVFWKLEIPVLFHFLLFYSDKYQGCLLSRTNKEYELMLEHSAIYQSQ